MPRILRFLNATPGVFPVAGFHSSITSTSVNRRTVAILRTAGSAFSARASFRVTSFFLHRILAFPSFPLCANSGAIMRLPRPSTAMRNSTFPHTTRHFSSIETPFFSRQTILFCRGAVTTEQIAEKIKRRIFLQFSYVYISAACTSATSKQTEPAETATL